MRIARNAILCLPILCVAVSCQADAAPELALPAPSEQPLHIDMDSDPILKLRTSLMADDVFRSQISLAVARNPALAEARAGEAEAIASRREARSALFPRIDLAVTGNRSFAREFSNDPGNVLERTRPRQRADAVAGIQQTLVDFGATSNRIDAADARIRAAAAQTNSSADAIALQAITAWYQVFAYRSLESLAEDFVERQAKLRGAIDARIAQGLSAPGDRARVDSYIASARTRLAAYRRQLAGVEARYRELIGDAPSALIKRPSAPEGAMSLEFVQRNALRSPAVLAADQEARAAREEAHAVRADNYPNLSAGVDAGRYGLFGGPQDYDIRGRLTLRARLSAGLNARADQTSARAAAAEARAARIREEAIREVSVAWSDVGALENELAAVEANYVASRLARDVVAERFRVARGTIVDLLAVEDDYFGVAAAYVQTLVELDVARYALLSRNGSLLDLLAIAPAAGGERG